MAGRNKHVVIPSGRGSFPPGALGRSSWHSGMVLPRNRIPSSASRTEPSQTRALIPRAPPYTWSRVTLSTTLEPCSLSKVSELAKRLSRIILDRSSEETTRLKDWGKSTAKVDAYFRRVLICSIFSGRSSAKRSFRVWRNQLRQYALAHRMPL